LIEWTEKTFILSESVALLVARRTNNRKAVGSMPAVYHSVGR